MDRLNSTLTNLDGLVNVTNVEGFLRIESNPALQNVDGLTNLRAVGDYFYIENNDAISNLDGLDNLASVAATLMIYDNDSLREVDGLANLESLGNLFIAYNADLRNLDGFSNLTNVGYVAVASNINLGSVSGLGGLSSVGSHFAIENNDTLSNVDGLQGLTSVGDYLIISFNDALRDLDGLAGLTEVVGHLVTRGNAQLAKCQGLAKVLGWPSGPDLVGGSVVINSNSPGCNSVSALLSSVSGPTQTAITAHSRDRGDLLLYFSQSTTDDTAFPITGYQATCSGEGIDTYSAPYPYLQILDNAPIENTIRVSGVDGFEKTAFEPEVEVDIHILHSDPSDLYITLTTPEGTELVLWDQTYADGAEIEGTFPIDLNPVTAFDNILTENLDGQWRIGIEDQAVGPIVREGELIFWGLRIYESGTFFGGPSSPIEVVGLGRGRDYTCTVAPETALGVGPVSPPYTANVPYELPTTPVIRSADHEDETIRLIVSVGDDGGAAITGYTATCTDGTNTYTGTSTSSPITVSGLTNDVAYTCTVTATNSVGTSSASAATDPITPEATAIGLPIWLLYQATQ